MRKIAPGLETLNSNGCGVCEHRVFPDDKKPSLWERFKTYIGKKTDYTNKVWCSIHKKWKKNLDICMDFKSVKQILIWGTKKDESVPLDRRYIY